VRVCASSLSPQPLVKRVWKLDQIQFLLSHVSDACGDFPSPSNRGPESLEGNSRLRPLWNSVDNAGYRELAEGDPTLLEPSCSTLLVNDRG
jgi:hypothetical protein